MSTLHRAILKAYTAATHKADVQLAASVPTRLTAVPVATDIPPAECVPGRECAVLLFDDNPDNAVIITIHGAVPSGGGGGGATDRIQDADANTYVDTETATPDQIEMAIAGTLRYVMKGSSPHHNLTGDLRLDGSIGINQAPNTALSGQIAAQISGSYSAGGTLSAVAINAGPTISAAMSTFNLLEIFGTLGISANITTFYGLNFRATISNTATITEASIVRSAPTFLGGGVTTDAAGFTADPGSNLNQTQTRRTGFWMKSPSVISGAIQTVYGFRCATLAAGSVARHPFYDEGTAASGNTRGNVFKSSTQFFKDPDLGGGDRVIGIGVAQTVPTTNPGGGVILYVDPADNRLKCRGSAGTVTVLANP